MSMREQFQAAAVNAVYSYLANIRTISDSPEVIEAMEDAPLTVTKGRSLRDMALDDMMERFAVIMAPAKDRRVVPSDIYYWLMQERLGYGNITKQESDLELARAIQDTKYAMEPTAMPEFLDLLRDTLTGTELAKLTNEWNSIFTTVVRLTTSDDSMNINHRNISTQNAMVKSANEAIALKASSAARKGVPGKTGGDESDFGDDGEDGDDEDELETIGKKLKELTLPEKALQEVKKLYRRTKQMPPMMSERHTNIKRLELIALLPWGQYSEIGTDLQTAEDILNEDHYGLDKVKKKVIQHLAVQQRTGAANGKIICLVGPPGVGKTSIAKSVARATGRSYARVSLGGVHDESKIRGHSSTYVGALPGIVINGIKEAGKSNALMVLDEIDKMGQESRQGDPTAALLEVLDPEQNHTFRDDFMGVEYDLSKVFFFATANDLGGIPGPLRDRMQIITLPGYMPEEKFEIAMRYLMPKQMKQTGLSDTDIVIHPAAIKELIAHYTGEAGVRGLEKKINEICGVAVVKITKGEPGPLHVTAKNLPDFIGPGHGDREKIPSVDMVGVVNGLAYSSIGGSVLPIEASTVRSFSGFRMVVSGNLGKVMGESAGVAEALVRARAPQFGISDLKLRDIELRVHAPAGAVPKDGPSAGAAFTTAIISTLTGIPIKRDVAMTGEINSRGEVTAIGGLPEKLQGAVAAGVKTVLIPKQNIPDLLEVPESVKAKLTIIPVGTIEEVLKNALIEDVKPLVTAPKTLRVRFREAIAVFRSPSNDNASPSPRQAAGARPSDLKPF